MFFKIDKCILVTPSSVFLHYRYCYNEMFTVISPTMLSLMMWLFFGSVEIWHSYSPSSRACTYLTCRVQVSDASTKSAWNLSSGINMVLSTERICESLLLIHDTFSDSRTDKEISIPLLKIVQVLPVFLFQDFIVFFYIYNKIKMEIKFWRAVGINMKFQDIMIVCWGMGILYFPVFMLWCERVAQIKIRNMSTCINFAFENINISAFRVFKFYSSRYCKVLQSLNFIPEIFGWSLKAYSI